MTKLITLFLALSPFFLFSQTWNTYPYHEEGSVLHFPDDEGHHPVEPIEWWYTNAFVTGQNSGTEYSFMLTYFYYPGLSWDGFRILNLANEDTGEFFEETLPATYPMLAQDHLEITADVGFFGGTTETWVTKTDNDGNLIPWEYHLSASGAYGALELDYKALKPPLMVGGTGYVDQGVDNYSFYYSQTMIEVSGTITFDGTTEPINGVAWIDRQYGDFNPSVGEPYEWFSLQLSNGMDINLWNIFTFEDQIPDTSTYRIFTVYVDDTTTVWGSDFELERLAFDWAADEAVCYSQQWRFTADALDIDLLMTVNYPDHEVFLPFRFYEGTTTIEGTIDGQTVTGMGFAELLHHYEDPQIHILSPAAGEPWNNTQPISWELLNPDDGRPVRYDVEVSNDDKVTWTPIAEGLPETEHLWDASGWPGDSLYWFRITGYSIDNTLTGSVESDMAYGILTDVEEVPSDLQFRVFPNPATEKVILDISEKNQVFEAKLFNAAGDLVLTIQDYPPLQFDLSELTEGTYWVWVQGMDGRIFRKMILKI